MTIPELVIFLTEQVTIPARIIPTLLIHYENVFTSICGSMFSVKLLKNEKTTNYCSISMPVSHVYFCEMYKRNPGRL